MQRLFEGGVYFKIIFLKSLATREILHGGAAKYGHFELRNIVLQENKFPRMVKITELHHIRFFSYNPQTNAAFL